MKNRITLYTFSLLLCLCSLQAMAQREPDYIAPALTGDSIYVGKSLVLKDSLFFDSTLKPSIRHTNSVYNFISLRLNEYSNKVLPDSFVLSVTMQVNYSDSNNIAGSIASKTLTLTYYKDSAYNNKAVFFFQGAHYVEAKITGITCSSNVVASNILPLVQLDNRMIIDRDYLMTCMNQTIDTVNKDESTITQNGELKISWGYDGIPEWYDVEWTYIDSSALASHRYDSLGSLSPYLIFKNNATRISTKNHEYQIPLLYDGTGTLFYRVRGAQVDQNGEIITTKWSSDINPNSTQWSYTFTGHERNLNWQATTTFAEEGKRKSVVQYFDGSLRGRQVVTRDNTTQTTVVAETLYDKQGRPVIQVMPAPTLSTLIKYTPSFNVADMNGAEYDKDHYDNAMAYCDMGADSMSMSSGASQYYSPLNPLRSQGFHKYIPIGNNFPFTETQYTQDNTGRIYRQSGVDSTFRIGKGHETKYYYSVPSQVDLDALFGTEVGEASHYQKNMVRDANGQYSVSYVDMHGRTIATALAGTSPVNLSALSSYRPDSVQSEQLLTTTNNVLNGDRIEYSSSMLMTKNDSVWLHYTLGKQSLKLADCHADSICYDCLYDLSINITGDCSSQIFGGGSGKSDTTIRLSNFKLWKVDTACGLATPIDTTIRLFLNEGSYTINKVLSINHDGMNKYRDSVYMARNTCFTYDSLFLKRMRQIKDSMVCSTDTLPTLSNLIYREQMLEDLYPLTGQYGQYADTASCISIFNKSDLYTYLYQKVADTGVYKNEFGQPDSVVNSQGQSVAPQNLTPEEFISNFKPSWATTLLSLHPEYPLLVQYEKFTDSHNWDEDFSNTETYQDALAKGYLNPTGSSRAPANRFLVNKTDPLYTNIYGGSAAQTAIEDSLFTFRKGDASNPDLTLWGFATAIAHCSAPESVSCINLWNQSANTFSTASLCTGELDMAWRLFRDNYLNKKREWIENYMRSNAGGINYPVNPCTPVFPLRNALLDSAGYNVTTNGFDNNAVGQANAQNYYSDNCNAYRDRWAQQLQYCGYPDSIKAQILDQLVNVCKEGADQNHPYGASTVKPGSTYPYKSFVDVIQHYNALLGKPTDVNCNGYQFDQPLPYNQPSLIANQELWTKPDSCSCTRINDLYSSYSANTASYSSFSDYIQKTLNTTISDAALDSLRNLCNGTITCKFIAKPIILPPALQCGVTAPCVNCNLFKSTLDSFKLTFAGVIPTIQEGDTVQAHINQIFANYMNQRFGFHKTAIDYLEFAQTCQLTMSAFSDSLSQYITDFKTNYSALANGQIYQNYKITDAPIAMVTAANAVLAARYGLPLPSGYALQPRNGNFTGLLRGVTKNDPDTMNYQTIVPFPLNYTFSTTSLQSNTVLASDFAAGPVTARDLSTKYLATVLFDRGYGFQNLWPVASMNYTHVTTPLSKYLGNLVNQSFTFAFFNLPDTITTPAQFSSFYINNVNDLGRADTYTSAVIGTDSIKAIKNLRFATEFLPQSNMSAFNGNAQTLKVTLDMMDGTSKDAYMYARYDNTGYVTYKEIIDTNLYSTDCSKAFTYYFNQKRGTNYTATQIDSIYWANLGKPPAVCNNSDSECNQYKALLDSFPAYHDRLMTKGYGDPIYDSSGTVVNNWTINTDGWTHDMRYRFTDFLQNGILTQPSTDTITRFLYYNYVNPVCVSDGFTWEVRMRFPIDSLKKQRYIRSGGNGDLYGDVTFESYFPQENGHSDEIYGRLQQTAPNAFFFHYNYRPTGEQDLVGGSYVTAMTTDLSYWRTFKFTYKNGLITAYLDTTLLFTEPYSSKIVGFKELAFGSLGYDLQLDWMKLYDQNDSLRMYEDFSDNQWADASFDRNCIYPSCDSTFKEYFNSRLHTNYTYSQIQSIYHTCGITLDPCGTNSQLLCGQTDAVNEAVLLDNSPCADSTNLATATATYLYQYYQDSLKSGFNEAYMQRCLNIAGMENLVLSKPVSEYHYTLYYYDQAGNLVKTIPPEGVHPNRNGAWMDSVKAARSGGTLKVPAHTLATTYRYNSLNQVVSQKSPDGGLSAFWYDRLGRLSVSQNAVQRAVNKYSITQYDALGRITLVGQKLQPNPITQTTVRDQRLLQRWQDFNDKDTGYRPHQITLTKYDNVSNMASVYAGYPFHQKAYTLRNRVSSVRYYDEVSYNFQIQSNGDTLYIPVDQFVYTAIDYSYDIHGSVDSMLNIYQKTSPLVGHGMNQFKLIAYRYDLISGKVNEVHYQPGFSDEFYHRYEYDADNRLTDVYTTDSKVLLHQKDFEDHEAHYEYYKHGPLARAVIGEQQVQGIDYAYTLQGWLKGINSTSLNPTVDMGGDGTSGSMVARDALGYNLSYFPGDYSHIDFGVSVQPFPGYTGQVGTYRPLYNGNIASMAVNISRLRQPQIYAYGYDQLNRLASMDVYRGLDSANNNWGGSQLTALGDYQERVTYDGNGNILKYLRQGYGSKLSMDSLSYNYYTGTNQLRYVRDRINGSTSHSSNYTSNNEGIEDLEDQADSNYVYDAIGNLQVDKKEGITSIFWNVYGKMMDLHRTASTNNKLTAEYYHYDPNGNRVGKDIVRSGQTNEFDWYVRDAQGNVMAVYRKDNLIYSQGQMYLKEHHLYGSSRLGIVQRNQNIDSARVQPEYLDLLGAAYTYNFTRGKKLYELSNHLGNVLTTVTDKKVGHPAGDGTYDFYYADVASAQDYYPFGMEMPGRVYTPSKYRYGFNGKESDNELKTQGNQYDYGKRVYDPRVSKFLSVDPLAKGYPWFSPYQYCGNSPVTFRDLDGMEMAWRSPVTGEIKPAGPVSLPIGSRNSDGWIFISSTTIFAPPPAHKPAVQQGSDQMTSVKTAVNQQIVHKIVDQKAKAAKSAKSDPTVVESDMFGTAQIGPKSVVEAKINAIRSEYNTAVGDNIRNGLGGALGYIFGGDRGSFKGAVVDNVALSFAGIPGNTNLSPRDIELQPKINWPASGPIGGVIELSDYAKSNNAFLNSFQGEKAKDFVFDPISNRLVVGGKNYEMGHFGLVRSIGANEKLIVGGRIRMTQDGSIEFNEWSGHYGDQWTDAMRNTVSKFLKNQTGRQVIQSKSMNFSDGTH